MISSVQTWCQPNWNSAPRSQAKSDPASAPFQAHLEDAVSSLRQEDQLWSGLVKSWMSKRS